MRDTIRSRIEKPAIEMPNSEEALERLMAGNKRYVNSILEHPDQSSERRIALQQGQHPFVYWTDNLKINRNYPMIM